MEHLWAWAAWTWDLHIALDYGNSQYGPSTASAPHTSQQYLFSVTLPLHSTTEQVSPSKWPLSLPHVKVEIRHWRDLQAEEADQRKEKKGKLPEKSQVQHIKILKLSRDCAFEVEL